ncbi:hypothetical protein V6N13_114864 [Hibiscus sabdariffa]
MEQVKAYSAEEGEATSVGSQRGGQKNGETTKTQVLSELEHGPGTDSQTHNCQQIKGFWNQGQTRQIEEANSVILSPLNLETFRQPSIVVQWLGYLAFTQETRVQFPAMKPCHFFHLFLLRKAHVGF